MATVLANATVVTVDGGDRVLAGCDIRMDGSRITGVGPSLASPGDEIWDCSHTVIIPGLVNVHTHAATGLFRGLADDKPADFWSPHFRVPGQERLTLGDYQTSLRAVCAESLLNGVTCIADRLGDMDKLAPVIEDSGIRAVVGHTLRDNSGPADWKTVDLLIERYGVDPARRVWTGLAPHALDSCSDALLRTCADRAQQHGCRVFIHVAQSRVEVSAVHDRNHHGALACLVSTGVVGQHVVAAHGIYLTDAEIAAWPSHAISIAHCPASNLKIEARTLPLHRLHGQVAIGLGTDWAVTNNGWDMLAEARLAAFVGKMQAADPTVLTVRDMMRMLTIDGARVLGADHLIGSIEPGKRADIVVLDGTRLAMTPNNDPMSNVVYSANPSCVRDVFVDGRPLVRQGRLTEMDERTLAIAHSAIFASKAQASP